MKKRLLGILLSFALMLTMMPVLGLNQTAWAYTYADATVAPDGAGTVTKYVHGSDCDYTATPSSADYVFDHWEYTGTYSGSVTNNPLQFGGCDVTQITAVFNQVTKYPLWVGGTQVTSANKDDVLKGTVNEGKVSFTPAKDGDPAKLTLKGANIKTGYNDTGAVYGIYYTEEYPLTIESPSGTDNKIIGEQTFNTGIRAADADITLSGGGNLTVDGGYRGIDMGSVTIDGTNVTATGDVAIHSGEGVTITGGNVTATGTYTGLFAFGTFDGNVIVKGGNVTATGQNAGINSYGNVIIDGGNIEAAGRFGIASENVTINDGTVNATGTDSDFHGTGMSTMSHYDPAGIFAEKTVEIKGGNVTAAGDGYGILGTVKNHIDGTGWTDKAGSQGEAAIPINTVGQDLSKYKKVQFPAEVDEVTVKFDSAGGSAVASQTIAKGTKATKPADPTRSGYTFDGWYNGNTTFDFNTAVNESITLTAHWKENAQPTPAPAAAPVSNYVRNNHVTAGMVKAVSDAGYTAIVLGRGTKKIDKAAFAGTNIRTVHIRSKKLTKKGVKNSLKGSSVTKIRVNVKGGKSADKKYVKKYKKIFTKKNCGKKVKVSL